VQSSYAFLVHAIDSDQVLTTRASGFGSAVEVYVATSKIKMIAPIDFISTFGNIYATEEWKEAL
jgi:hypothetical protein